MKNLVVLLAAIRLSIKSVLEEKDVKEIPKETVVIYEEFKLKTSSSRLVFLKNRI